VVAERLGARCVRIRGLLSGTPDGGPDDNEDFAFKCPEWMEVCCAFGHVRTVAGVSRGHGETAPSVRTALRWILNLSLGSGPMNPLTAEHTLRAGCSDSDNELLRPVPRLGHPD
jgi:hypothetical protein